ncbi:hypothetical protein ABXS75_17285 [Roseburia hominis]
MDSAVESECQNPVDAGYSSTGTAFGKIGLFLNVIIVGAGELF